MSTVQQRISPHVSPNKLNLDTGSSTTGSALMGGEVPDNPVDFKSLMQRSNYETQMKRIATDNGGDIVADSKEDFLEKMQKRNDPLHNKKPSAEMDKDAFLKLFVTQLQNQDPLNPDDSAKMAANLAQFQGLEQMTNVNKNLEKLSGEQSLGRAVGLIDFVGKEVKIEGGKFRLSNGKTTDARFALNEAVPQAILQVRDASGAVIAKKELGNLEKGDHKVAWDGKAEDGKGINNGLYTFTIAAQNLEGTEVPVAITSTVKVTGVDIQEAGGAFYTELGKISVDKVSSVGDMDYSPLREIQKDKVPPVGSGDTKAQDKKPNVADNGQPPPELIEQAQAAIAQQILGKNSNKKVNGGESAQQEQPLPMRNRNAIPEPSSFSPVPNSAALDQSQAQNAAKASDTGPKS